MTGIGGGAATTAMRIGLATAGVGVGAWALTRAFDSTSPGDDYPSTGGSTAPGYSEPYPGTGGSTSPGDDYPSSPSYPGTPSYPSYPTYPSDPGGGYYPTDPYPTDPGGSWPDPSYPTYPTYPTYPDYPTYPTYPDYPSAPQTGLWNAVYNAAPYSWSSADVSTVASAASVAGASTWEAADMVREVYRSTPYSWSGSQEARVAATGLLNHRSAHETGNVIDQVEWATPAHWSTRSDVRLAVAALQGGVPSSRVDDIVRDASYHGSESQGVAEAEARLLAGGGYGSYPLPGYPGGTSPGDDW